MNNSRTRFLVRVLLSASLWLILLITGGDGLALDRVANPLLDIGDDPAMARAARALALLGEWQLLTAAVLAAAVYVALRGRKRRAALLLITVVTGRLMIEIQKMLVDRDQPGVPKNLEAVHSMSFPSTHAANAMITFLAIALLVPVPERLRPLLVGIGVTLGLAAGWSQLALGASWASDVIGGWAFGLLWVMLLLRLATDRPGD